jgi:phosphoglucomutase
MNEEESIATYFLHVDEIVNTFRGLGEEIKETITVKKFLRSLPSIFDPKIFSIEEIKDLDNMTMDELHGIPTAYEMRIEKDKPTNPSRKESSFKASKKINIEEYKTNDNSDSESDVEEANFFRNLKRGTRKYKGKIPFRCFNYGEVGNFTAKCPYAKI